MQRRYFDFLYGEICMAMGQRVPRYDLWLLVSETGGDPNHLTREQVRRFIDLALDGLLVAAISPLPPRARQRLLKRLLTFDPRYPTPEEWLTGLGRTTA